MWRPCIRSARDIPRHTARTASLPWHRRWALVPACCLLHGCITGDVPLLSSGEANFKYHKHNNTLKETLSAVPNASAPLRARLVALGSWLGTPRGSFWATRLPLSDDPHSLTLLLPLLTHLLTYPLTYRHHHEVGLLYRTIHKIHHLFANTLPIDSGK